MASTKFGNLAVKIQTPGMNKPFWKQIGVARQSPNGDIFLMIDRDWNPAGVPVDDPTKRSILVALFEEDESGRKTPRERKPASKGNPWDDPNYKGPRPEEDFDDDDVPF